MTATPQSEHGDFVTNRRTRIQVFTGALMGNVIGSFDLTLYGTLAFVISDQFFPAQNPILGLFATYAGVVISYAIRPLAGLFMGPIGDIRGRRYLLVLTVVLMTVGTALIGFLPTYGAIGLAAPIILIASRLLQGIGGSVEYTTATQFMLEHVGGRRRNFVTGISNSSESIGPFIASGVAFILAQSLSSDAFGSWGWRIPFYVAIPIALGALYIRLRIDESPDFKRVLQEVRRNEVKQKPLREAVGLYWRRMLQAIGLSAGQRVGSYIIQAYFVTALVESGFPASKSILASMLTYAVGPITSVLGGVLADRFGARVPLILGYGLFIVTTVPAFYLISGDSIALATTAVIVFTLINNIVAAPLTTAYVLSFPADVRATAGALTFNVGTTALGSTAGLVATGLFAVTNSNVSFGWYVTAACIVSVLVAFFALPDCLKGRASGFESQEA